MLPVLLVIFSLLQLLHADEFPNLMKHIEITWDKTSIASKVDARMTMSTDGLVPSFILCGAFPTSEYDGNCTLKYDYKYYLTPIIPKEGSGNMNLTARILSTVNSSYSCMNFVNNVTDFATLYRMTEQNPSTNSYSFAYTCESTGSSLGFWKGFLMCVFVAFAFLVVVVCGYKCGVRKNMGVNQQNVYNYRAYEPENNNVPVVYGGPGAYGGNQNYAAPARTEEKTTTTGGNTLYTPYTAN